ncbi:MAG: DUF559 domain-containing protein [Solirubrobacteraceae bacterium]|nr:DUF559 domain-containing protein [Solirubrobacteraceae bacterium]
MVRFSTADGLKSAPRADVAVARLATNQNSIVSTRQLAARGILNSRVTVRVRRGQLHRVHRGVYAIVPLGLLTLKGELTAAALACGDGAVLGDHSAAAWHGMFTWDGRRPEVIVMHGAGRKLAGIRTRRSTTLDHRRDVWRRDGILVTSPARTLLDLAAVLPRKALRRMARQALAEGRVGIRQLADVVDRSRGHRGAKALRAIVADGYVPTRSELEDRALDALARAGIERPDVNPPLVLDDRRVHPDLLWRRLGLVVELDGARWHSDPLARDDDAERQALLEAHGYRVLRVTWSQLVNSPRQTIARVRAALEAQARLRSPAGALRA